MLKLTVSAGFLILIFLHLHYILYYVFVIKIDYTCWFANFDFSVFILHSVKMKIAKVSYEYVQPNIAKLCLTAHYILGYRLTGKLLERFGNSIFIYFTSKMKSHQILINWSNKF